MPPMGLLATKSQASIVIARIHYLSLVFCFYNHISFLNAHMVGLKEVF